MIVGTEQGLEQNGASANGASANGGIAPADSRDGMLTAALQLGWRVAELYAQIHDCGEQVRDTLLPASNSLKPSDQLDLQLRAAAGDARRAGLVVEAEAFEHLKRLIPEQVPGSPAESRRFRRQVRRCHIELSKSLWARDEAAGKAYELGNGMSDTYSRVRRSYSEETKEEAPRSAWINVFEAGRIERLKQLLDDLQSRLSSRGAVVVRDHLDVWRDQVPKRIKAAGPPEEAAVRHGLRRQTVIWRQLVSGDKDPEAYLDSEARAELRGDLRKLAWSRCRYLIPVAALVLGGFVWVLPHALEWYERGGAGTVGASAVLGIAGAVGVTKASIVMTVRARLDHWSKLLWNRAIAKKVSDRTLVIDSVLPATRGTRLDRLHRRKHRRGPIASGD